MRYAKECSEIPRYYMFSTRLYEASGEVELFDRAMELAVPARAARNLKQGFDCPCLDGIRHRAGKGAGMRKIPMSDEDTLYGLAMFLSPKLGLKAIRRMDPRTLAALIATREKKLDAEIKGGRHVL
jgi:hypothetical protein